jgi:hypothetical protein
LWKAKVISNVLINLVQEISVQHSIQIVTWLSLATFSQFYTENREQKSDGEKLKMCSFARKGAHLKL